MNLKSLVMWAIFLSMMLMFGVVRADDTKGGKPAHHHPHPVDAKPIPPHLHDFTVRELNNLKEIVREQGNVITYLKVKVRMLDKKMSESKKRMDKYFPGG